MGKQAPIAVLVAVQELLAGHVPGLENDVRRIVEAPVAMHDALLLVELIVERRAGVGRENVERRALEAALFDPFDRLLEHAHVVVIETEHEAAIHLDTVVVQDRDAARVVIGHR